MQSNPSPFLQMSYETTCGFLTSAILSKDFDTISSPSARLVVGKVTEGGTGSFEILQPLF
jgi:DNA-directed RNA polymerase I subunit RPA1